MYLTTDSESLKVYEALASEVRLRIIDLLGTEEMHIKELAERLYLSSAIVSSHVTKLQKAGIVSSQMKRIDGGTYKYCSLSANFLQIKLSGAKGIARKVVEVSVPVGHYTDLQAFPTCGIATTDKLIGYYDDPRYFLDPERVDAGILWFAKGYAEYKVPNYLFMDQKVQEIEISLELGSEAPNVNEKWPSEILFALNGHDLGKWTSPGDFGVMRGRLTPSWWNSDVNQYGLLKVLRVNRRGTYIDGQQISSVTLDDVCWQKDQWTFRLTAEDSTRRRGGLTLYGRGFGNYEQDIVFRVYYE
ncbi:ArsR family transcriptional regulator [Paenibacillus sp. DMB5]|uniref:ArsR/SmtB family transcription factor n=1 Tax=Paenibacillus sp. DMB5 TaxID=1780103 RepID=UPI00076BE39B|nr:ArsR family transcriptional regulator [Paenibacillus sp. DMB5]KUP24557.1 ArsR family transcriptional regulator [Paenibacillus sp. DMB5]